MSLLVDTSVWSLLLLRKKTSDHPAALFLRQKIEEKAKLHITGIIYQEVLQGIRSDTHYQSVKSCLKGADCLEPSLELHDEAAGLFKNCRRRGIQAGTVDCLIAAVSIHYGCSLLTTDPDFSYIAECSPLRLVDTNSL